MTITRNISLIALCTTALLVGHCQASSTALRGSADVPRLDARQEFKAEDFAFDLMGAEPEIEGDAGTVKVSRSTIFTAKLPVTDILLRIS